MTNIPKLAIGTVQFGLDYGISNNSGKTPEAEVKKILDYADRNRIDLLDTASIYGDSETVLGNYINDYNDFKVVTKVSGTNTKDAIKQSLFRLKKKSLYGVLIHNPLEFNKKSYSELMKFKELGITRKIGVSIYSKVEIEKIIERYDLDIIQLPLNIFDRRLINSGTLNYLKDKGIEIHTRSAFLQGLIFVDTTQISSFFNPIKHLLNNFQHTVIDLKLSVEDVCLNFLKEIKQLDYIVCGVNNLSQIKKLLSAYNKKINISNNFDQFIINEERFLNPALWEK